MASLIQQVLVGLSTLTSDGDERASNWSSTTRNSATTNVTDISSLVAFLFSLAALRDWLKLILIGGFLEALRRLTVNTYESFVGSFWVTAYFDEDDSSYSMCHPVSFWGVIEYSSDPFSGWMMVWLSKQPNWGEFVL